MRISENNKAILTIAEVSRQFSFPEITLRKLVKAGNVPTIKIGNRVYITRDAMAEYLKTGGLMVSPGQPVKGENQYSKGVM